MFQKQSGIDLTIPAYYDCKVLYIGKNNQILSIVQEPLRSLKINLLNTENPRNALNIVKTESPDLILMEKDLSGKQGFKLCDAIRSNHSIPPIPVIYLLSSYNVKNQIDALKEGADGFLEIPLNPDLLSAMVISLLNRHNAQVKNYRLLRILEKYISSRARERVGQTGTEKITATVLFSDMRGFTETTMKKRAEDVFESISEIHARQVEIIHHFGGYIDKFTGDGLLAAFDEGPTHITDACRAALAIVKSLLNTEKGSLWSPPPIGIGIHSGQLLRGNLGGPEHMDFSIIGTTVNIAARLCGQAQPLEIIISESVAKKIKKHFSIDEGRVIKLRGVGESKIHRLLGNHTSE